MPCPSGLQAPAARVEREPRTTPTASACLATFEEYRPAAGFVHGAGALRRAGLGADLVSMFDQHDIEESARSASPECARWQRRGA